MNKGAFIIAGGLLALGLCFDLAYGQQGNASLYLRRTTTQQDSIVTEFTAKVGETVTLDVYMNTGGDAVTGLNVLISYDSAIFDPVLQAVPGLGQAIFKPGNGIVTQNGFVGGDAAGNPNGNGLPGYQLAYTEEFGLQVGGQQPSRTGKLIITTLKVKILRKPASGQGTIQVDGSRGDGATSYSIAGQAGKPIGFRSIKSATITIIGFAVQPIPDILLAPRGTRTLDLHGYVDTNVTWVPSPVDSVTAQVDPQTQALTVSANTGFVGVRTLTLTATTLAGGETAQVPVRVIVSSPPSILKGSLPDTVRFAQNTVDSTLSLAGKARDPDSLKVPLSWTASQGKNVSVRIDSTKGYRVFLTPTSKNFYGSEKIQFTVSNQYGLKDSASVVALVTHVNQPPEFFRPFPLLTIPVNGGDSSIVLNAYLRDVDNDLFDPNYVFFTQTTDSILVSRRGLRLTVTPVPGALGDKKINVFAIDPDGARTSPQTLTVRVIRATGPALPPVVHSPVPDKIGVVRGGAQAVLGLDSLVTDPDTPVNQIQWRVGPTGGFQVNIDAQRRAIFQAPASFVGFEVLTFTATDPDSLKGSFQIIAFSVEPGIPDVGGLPDTSVVVGSKINYVNFNNYIFDSNDPDSALAITPTAPSDLKVVIDPKTHQSTIEALAQATQGTKQVVFEVKNKTNKTGLDTILVRVTGAEPVRLKDFLDVTFRVDQADQSLRLDASVLSGRANELVWTVQQISGTRLSVTVDANRVVTFKSVGGFTGTETVTFTARDPLTSSTAVGTVRVTVLPTGGIKLKKLPDVTFPSGATDRNLRLNSYVDVGDTTRLAWKARTSSGRTNTVTTFIDPATRVVTLGSASGFTGTETVIFTAQAGQDSAETSAQVTVTPAGVAVGDLKLVTIANPVQRAFVDVFVAAKKDLASEPTVIVELGGVRSLIPMKKIQAERAGNIWSGNLNLQAGKAGSGRILASAVTTQQVALADTLRFSVGTVNPGFSLTVSGPGASLTMPPDAFRKPTVVALIQNRDGEVGGGAAAKPAAAELIPVSEAYLVVMTETPARAGELRFDTGEMDADLAERAGVYRKDGEAWIYVAGGGSRVHLTNDSPDRSTTLGQVSAPILQGGIYRVMVARDLTDGSGSGGPIGKGMIPETYQLEQNYPNPFNPATSIRFSIPEAGLVHLRVYDVTGRVVRTLMDGAPGTGRFLMTWDGTDEAGRRVASGVYFYRLETTGATLTRKMMLLK